MTDLVTRAAICYLEAYRAQMFNRPLDLMPKGFNLQLSGDPEQNLDRAIALLEGKYGNR